MKVFLSWSGSLSHTVAGAVRDWLPSVLQFTEPYVSSEDIDKGARWSTDIAQELEASSYGIVVLTRENAEAPWIAFEAGALSKALDKSRVSPFLVNLKRSELQGPLVQFQSTIYEKHDVLKLVKSINGSATEAEKLDDTRLRRVFEVWWPELQKALDALISASAPTPRPRRRSGDETSILEELLELARSQQRILSDPAELLPARYLAELLNVQPDRRRGDTPDPDAWLFLFDHFDLLRKRLVSVMSKKTPTLTKTDKRFLTEEIGKLESVVEYLDRHFRLERRPRQLRLPT